MLFYLNISLFLLKLLLLFFELVLFCFIYYFICSKRCIFPIYIYTLLKCLPLNQDLNSSHRLCKVIFHHYSLLRSLQLFWKWYLKKMCSNSLTIAIFHIIKYNSIIKSDVFLVIHKSSVSLWFWLFLDCRFFKKVCKVSTVTEVQVTLPFIARNVDLQSQSYDECVKVFDCCSF